VTASNYSQQPRTCQESAIHFMRHTLSASHYSRSKSRRTPLVVQNENHWSRIPLHRARELG
jgi:hypothetical protein